MAASASATTAAMAAMTAMTGMVATAATIALVATALLPMAHAQTALPSTPGWYAMPQTQLRTVCPPDNFGGTTYGFASRCSEVVAAWSSGVMDTTRNRLIVWGGGHNDYAGNELYAVNLDNQSIQRLTNPSVPTNAGGACTVTTLADGTPNSRHTYDSLAYMSKVDKMFAFGGSLACSGGYFNTDTWVYDFATSAWQKKAPSGTIPKAVPGIVTAYDPASGLVYLHDDWNLYSYDIAADRYSRLATDKIDYHLTAVIDPVRKKLVLIGGGEAWAYDIGPGSTYIRQTLATTGASAIVNSVYPGLAYDSASERIIAWNGGDTVYSLDLATGAWTPTTFAGGPGPAQQNGTYKRFSYSPASGAFVVVNSMAQDAYVLRLGAAATAGTTTPITTAPPPPPDTTPDFFGFTEQTGVALSAPMTSDSVTIAGINSPAPISVAGGTFSINGGAFGGIASTVTNGANVSVGLTSAATNSTKTCATLTIGGVAGLFCATTVASAAATTAPPTGTAGPKSAGTSFTLLSPTTQGLAPFTVGLGFSKGDVTTPILDIPDHQVVVMRRWNDGSVKHAIASGHIALTANVAQAVNASNSTTTTTATILTAASIASANPQASIAFGALGTVNLSALLATPFRTFVAGPEMVEAHYRGQVGSDPTLVAWFHVRRYKGGRIWIRAIAENSYLDVTPQSKSYVPVVSIGGTQVWNNGGNTLNHFANTRWAQEGWIGGDPQISPQINTDYLKTARLVPNFLAATADAAALNALYQTYAPNQNGNWTVSMGDTGYQDQIGLLPVWDALYVASGGDQRAFKSVVANAKALNSYPIAWTDSVTKLPVKPSDRPNWGFDGANAGGSTSRRAGTLTWEIAHHGSGGYLAYLITGDYYHLETMAHQSATAYLAAGHVDWTVTPEGPNLGTSRYFNGQTRGYAWAMRTLSQYAAIAPEGDVVAADYRTLLLKNVQRLKSKKDTVTPAGTGYVYEYDASLYGTGLVAPWQQHFFMQSLGMGSDLEPLTDMSAYNDVRDYMYRGAIGILGDASGYCFTQASVYNLKSNAGTGIAPNTWYKTWAQVYTATFATPPVCGNTLAGTSGSDPALAARGYWGNLIPAIAYAVDHGAAGASTAWARLTGAANWNAVLQSGFEKTPTWGVVPRSQAAATAVVTDTVPDSFTFAAQSDTALAAVVTSAPITVAGINSATAIASTGGAYSVNGGVFTTVAGSVNASDAVRVRLTASSVNSTQTCATVTIGGVTGQFCATTVAATVTTTTPAPDTTPDAFTLTPETAVTLAKTIVSNPVTVTGINAPSPISVIGGTYSVNDGAYTTSGSTVTLGNVVRVRLTTSGKKSAQTCATLTIGGVAGRLCATAASAESTAAANHPEAVSATSRRTTGPGHPDCADPCANALDIDGDGTISAATDGVLILRYMLGRTVESMVRYVGPHASRRDATMIVDYLDTISALLDVDGDGEIAAPTDAVLILRYLDGMRGDALVADAVGPDAIRTSAAQIEAWISSLLPTEAPH